MNRRNIVPSTTISLVLCGLLVGSSAFARDGWPYYGGNQGHERHATFTEITRKSVANLVLRRVFQLGTLPYSLSASPLVVDGIIYIATANIVQAFDLRTGMRKWSFQHKIVEASKGKASADAAALGFTSNCCSNTIRGVACAGGTIFLGTIDAKTGKTRWYFQIESHGLWDRDAITPPVVTMLEGRKVIVHVSKTGIMFVLDAKTGEYIRKSEIFVPQKNMWVAPTLAGVAVAPGAGGGNSWSPISVDPVRKLGFVGAMSLEVKFTLEKEIDESEVRGRSAELTTLGGDWDWDMSTIKGYFSAIDLTTGKIKWQHKSLPYIGGVLSTSSGLVFQG